MPFRVIQTGTPVTAFHDADTAPFRMAGEGIINAISQGMERNRQQANLDRDFAARQEAQAFDRGITNRRMNLAADAQAQEQAYRNMSLVANTNASEARQRLAADQFAADQQHQKWMQAQQERMNAAKIKDLESEAAARSQKVQLPGAGVVAGSSGAAPSVKFSPEAVRNNAAQGVVEIPDASATPFALAGINTMRQPVRVNDVPQPAPQEHVDRADRAVAGDSGDRHRRSGVRAWPVRHDRAACRSAEAASCWP